MASSSFYRNEDQADYLQCLIISSEITWERLRLHRVLAHDLLFVYSTRLYGSHLPVNLSVCYYHSSSLIYVIESSIQLPLKSMKFTERIYFIHSNLAHMYEYLNIHI